MTDTRSGNRYQVEVRELSGWRHYRKQFRFPLSCAPLVALAIIVFVSGGGSLIRSSLSMRIIATRQLISLRRPSGRTHPNSSHTMRERHARCAWGLSSMRRRMVSISDTLKSLPQYLQEQFMMYHSLLVWDS